MNYGPLCHTLKSQNLTFFLRGLIFFLRDVAKFLQDFDFFRYIFSLLSHEKCFFEREKGVLYHKLGEIRQQNPSFLMHQESLRNGQGGCW